MHQLLNEQDGSEAGITYTPFPFTYNGGPRWKARSAAPWHERTHARVCNHLHANDLMRALTVRYSRVRLQLCDERAATGKRAVLHPGG